MSEKRKAAHIYWPRFYTIDLGWPNELPGHPYLGPLYLERGGNVKPWQGLSVALFRTRKLARETLARLKKKNPKAKVVEVTITLKRIDTKRGSRD